MDGAGPVLEVIASSVADAFEAERGGATRLEVISRFEVGGLTPPLALVREVVAAVRIPVRVMLRESEGFEVARTDEVERLCAAARELAALPIDGLVLGFLRGRGLDMDLTGRILSCAPNLKATFHHAFEEADEPLRAIRILKGERQIDRLLTAGGGGGWPQKITRLASYEREAAPEITILAGGGMDAQAIREIRAATAIREFHVGRAARVPPSVGGVVRASRVRELLSSVMN